MGDIFGGGKTETKLESTLTPQQKRVQSKLGTYLLPQIGKGLPGYSGTLNAQLPSEYQESENYLQDVMNGKYSSKDYLEPYFKANIQDPLMKSWREDILPEIGGVAGKGGYFYGSGRESLERKSSEDLLNELGKQRTSLFYQANEAERTRQQAAAGQLLTSSMGETAVEQGNLTRTQEEWLRTQPEYNHMLQMIMGYLGQNYMAPMTTQTGPGLINSALTAFAGGVGSAMKF